METHRAGLVGKTQLSPGSADFRLQLEPGRCTGLEPGALGYSSRSRKAQNCSFLAVSWQSRHLARAPVAHPPHLHDFRHQQAAEGGGTVKMNKISFVRI
ncbi:hypothetical protein [Acidimangrovimonas pyrenivorans]|uniref:Uncharacterized protein n=1 Tax=Acidimangrovimonas pyrenivorans TaxID=2030798 RepID=A0ABV7ALB5_9RHOB